MRGTRRTPSLQLLPLEDRSLPAVSVVSALSSGILTVTGTDAADIIVVRQTGAGAVTLDANGSRRDFRGVSQVVVNGGNGNDSIYMDTRLSDLISIAPIPVKFNGGNGNDLLVGGAGADWLIGGDGDDTIYGDKGNDWIEGGNGADKLYGNDGDDVLMGGAGDDLLVGGAGSDYLDAGIGNDWLYGGDGADTLIGNDGNDYIEGGAGNDQLWGGAGRDWLYGGAGDDYLSGGTGDDYIDGGPGSDVLNGGEGFDTFFKDYGDVLNVTSSSDNVKQGAAGTCVILASLAAVRDSGVDLAARVTKTGTNQYSVPLYRPGTGWVTQTVYYDGQWTDNDPMVTSASDAWVLIYQRAYLQEMGVRWSDPDQSAWASKYGDRFQRADSALVAITGAGNWRNAAASGLTTADLSDLTTAVANRRPVIVLTRSGSLSSYGLIEDHAYTVQSVQVNSAGATTVTLRNPWGADGPIVQGANDGIITISWDAFRQTMTGFCVA